jgi:hypothetical protein
MTELAGPSRRLLRCNKSAAYPRYTVRQKRSRHQGGPTLPSLPPKPCGKTSIALSPDSASFNMLKFATKAGLQRLADEIQESLTLDHNGFTHSGS